MPRWIMTLERAEIARRNAAICEAFVSGKRVQQLADKYGVSHQLVSAVLKKGGLGRHDGGQSARVSARYAEIEKRIKAGVPLAKAANRLGVDEGTARAKLRKRGVSLRSLGKWRERAALAAKMLKMYKKGAGPGQIAKRLGLDARFAGRLLLSARKAESGEKGAPKYLKKLYNAKRPKGEGPIGDNGSKRGGHGL